MDTVSVERHTLQDIRTGHDTSVCGLLPAARTVLSPTPPSCDNCSLCNLPYTALCTCPTSLLATKSLINHADLFKPPFIQNVARKSDGRTGQQMERSTLRNNCSTLPTSAALSRTQSVLAGTPSAIWSRRDSDKGNRLQQCYCYWLVLGQCMVHGPQSKKRRGLC